MVLENSAAFICAKRLVQCLLWRALHNRHTAASLMLNNGVPVLVVSKILGHSKTSTTLDIYGHLIPTMQENAARIMDEVVTPIPVNFGELLETKTPD